MTPDEIEKFVEEVGKKNTGTETCEICNLNIVEKESIAYRVCLECVDAIIAECVTRIKEARSNKEK